MHKTSCRSCQLITVCKSPNARFLPLHPAEHLIYLRVHFGMQRQYKLAAPTGLTGLDRSLRSNFHFLILFVVVVISVRGCECGLFTVQNASQLLVTSILRIFESLQALRFNCCLSEIDYYTDSLAVVTKHQGTVFSAQGTQDFLIHKV